MQTGTYIVDVEKECIVDILRGLCIGNPVEFVCTKINNHVKTHSSIHEKLECIFTYL